MLTIAGLSFDSPFILAPLAGYTDLPFRLLCRRYGAGYSVSEMISCHGITYRQKKTLGMLQTTEEEQPVSFQLFGDDPDIMAEAASIMTEHNPAMIDINMGCPVKKVTRRGAGAALMSEPQLAGQIIKKVVNATPLPVTVKIRCGINAKQLNGVDFARMAEQAGVSAIAVHGRTWSQGFSGSADHAVLAEIKKSVMVPVIGNGDILTYNDGLKLMKDTGCDGVMIGRGALGNPWIFSGKNRPDSFKKIKTAALEHLDLIEQFLPADRVLGYIKNHLSRYFKGLPGSSRIRQNIFSCRSVRELREEILE
ncbi:tRNA dihydrouridine synthase DusB [Desulfomarina sp.]